MTGRRDLIDVLRQQRVGFFVAVRRFREVVSPFVVTVLDVLDVTLDDCVTIDVDVEEAVIKLPDAEALAVAEIATGDSYRGAFLDLVALDGLEDFLGKAGTASCNRAVPTEAEGRGVCVLVIRPGLEVYDDGGDVVFRDDTVDGEVATATIGLSLKADDGVHDAVG